MHTTRLVFPFAFAACLLAACDDSNSSAGADGGSGPTDTDSSVATSPDAAAATDAATGTADSGSGTSDIPAARTATLIVPVAAGPLTATTYQLPDTGTFAGQRNNDEFYAAFNAAPDFGSPFGGDSITLHFGGFFKTGTFACGDQAKPDDDYALETTIDLKTFVNHKSELTNFKGSNPGSTCSVTVTALDATTIQGTYTAKLYSDATTYVEISGAFHATP